MPVMPYKPLSRRQFLSLLPLGMAALLPLSSLSAQSPAQTTQAAVNIPPSLMLHSRESRYRFLMDLMAGIEARGWQTITYLEYLARAQNGDNLDDTALISIDDVSCIHGNPSFEYFQRMHDWIYAQGGTATFGVITRPDFDQDEAKWDILAGWVENGFELATHTANHVPFNEPDGRERRDMSQDAFNLEIVASARMIEDRMRARGLDYKVRTLITPYGSGWNRDTGTVFEKVRLACLEAGITFVVGIVDGRDPLPAAAFDDLDALLYTGRTPPGYIPNSEGGQTLDAALTLDYLDGWVARWHI